MLDFKFEDELKKFIEKRYPHNFEIIVKSKNGFIELQNLEDCNENNEEELLEEINDLKSEIEDLENQIEDLENENSKLENQIEDLESENN